jgi:hypothetical protein
MTVAEARKMLNVTEAELERALTTGDSDGDKAPLCWCFVRRGVKGWSPVQPLVRLWAESAGSRKAFDSYYDALGRRMAQPEMEPAS